MHSLTPSMHPSPRSWRFERQLSLSRERGRERGGVGGLVRCDRIKCSMESEMPPSVRALFTFFSFSASCQPRRERRLGIYCPSMGYRAWALRARARWSGVWRVAAGATGQTHAACVDSPQWRWGKSSSLWFLLVQNSKLKLDSLFPTRPDGDIPPL